MFDGCLRFYLTTSGLSFLCFRVTYVLYLNKIHKTPRRLRQITKVLRQYRTNELVRWRMHFLSDAIAEIEGLLEVNRDFCKKQMAEKASPALPTNCAVVP